MVKIKLFLLSYQHGSVTTFCRRGFRLSLKQKRRSVRHARGVRGVSDHKISTCHQSLTKIEEPSFQGLVGQY